MSPRRGGTITVRSLAAVLLAGLASPAAAQVSLQVVDSQGQPVPAVRVDVYGLGELIETVSTSEDGLVELSTEQWPDVRRVSLSHLAYQTMVIQIDDIPPDGVIRLEPEATEIEGFTVEAWELCPIDEDDKARELWEQVAARYSRDTGSRAWLAYFSRNTGAVREEDVHRLPDGGYRGVVSAGGAGVIHGDDHTPRSLDDRIAAEGYAWPPLVIAGTTGSREHAWGYPQLDWRHAYHFASPVFGDLHNFGLTSESTDDETTLVFCGKGAEGRATIKGVLTFIPNERFVSAEWKFETPEPDEGAGGSVTFARPGREGHLLAARGIFYRHSGVESPYPDLPRTYTRFVTRDLRWHLLPTGDRPCNTGLSFFGDPPKSPEGIRFAACVAENWGRY